MNSWSNFWTVEWLKFRDILAPLDEKDLLQETLKTILPNLTDSERAKITSIDQLKEEFYGRLVKKPFDFNGNQSPAWFIKGEEGESDTQIPLGDLLPAHRLIQEIEAINSGNEEREKFKSWLWSGTTGWWIDDLVLDAAALTAGVKQIYSDARARDMQYYMENMIYVDPNTGQTIKHPTKLNWWGGAYELTWGEVTHMNMKGVKESIGKYTKRDRDLLGKESPITSNAFAQDTSKYAFEFGFVNPISDAKQEEESNIWEQHFNFTNFLGPDSRTTFITDIPILLSEDSGKDSEPTTTTTTDTNTLEEQEILKKEDNTTTTSTPSTPTTPTSTTPTTPTPTTPRLKGVSTEREAAIRRAYGGMSETALQRYADRAPTALELEV